jgi:hypothetical protein
MNLHESLPQLLHFHEQRVMQELLMQELLMQVARRRPLVLKQRMRVHSAKNAGAQLNADIQLNGLQLQHLRESLFLLLLLHSLLTRLLTLPLIGMSWDHWIPSIIPGLYLLDTVFRQHCSFATGLI